VGIAYLIGILLLLVSLRVRAPLIENWARGSARTAPLIATGITLWLVASFAFELHVIGAAARAQPGPAWQRALPLALLTPTWKPNADTTPYLGTIVQLFAFSHTALLVALAGVLTRLQAGVWFVRALVLGGGAALGAEAFFASIADADTYLYVAHGLSADAYRPDRAALAGADAALAELWGRPSLPSAYGPLWNALERTVASRSTELGVQLQLFRCVGFAAMCASIAALAAMRRTVAVALFALNPMLWFTYVAQAHNDITGLALVLAALALRRIPAAAVVLVALAGAIKLPFLAVGIVVFAGAPNLRTRVLYGSAAVALGLAFSAAFGGIEYVRALQHVVRVTGTRLPLALNVTHATLALLGLAGLAVAVFARRFAWGVPWSFVAFGQYSCWQYLGWGIPYALLDGTQGALYLAALPFAQYEVNLAFDYTPLYLTTSALLVISLAVTLVLSLRHGRLTAESRHPEPAEG